LPNQSEKRSLKLGNTTGAHYAGGHERITGSLICVEYA